MSAQPSRDQFALFDMPPAAGPYPDAPGSKERGGTSEEAARRIAVTAHTLRAAVLAKFIDAGDKGLTADEVATALGRDELSVRPRCSELIAARSIIKTMTRRPSLRGATAVVMKALPKWEAA